MAGYLWLFLGIFQSSLLSEFNEVCLFKKIFHLPCPSCGSTRSVISISEGNFIEALNINPLGFVIACIMLVIPLWLIFDVLLHKKSLFLFYNKIEIYLKKSKYSLPLILLIIFNWIWNISKGL